MTRKNITYKAEHRQDCNENTGEALGTRGTGTTVRLSCPIGQYPKSIIATGDRICSTYIFKFAEFRFIDVFIFNSLFVYKYVN
jgi:hypothetical protein